MSKQNNWGVVLIFVFFLSSFSVVAQKKKNNDITPATDEVSVAKDNVLEVSDQITPTATGDLTGIDSDKGASTSGAHHIFPWGECTQFAADRYRDLNRKNITFRGNAKDWLFNARAAGYSTSTSMYSIVPKSIIVLGAFSSSKYGHVMIAEQVKGDSVYVSDSNWVGYHKTNKRWVKFSDLKRYNFQGVILP